LTWRATLRMRSISATDVPPNFMTRRAMAALHTGGVRRLQPDPEFAGLGFAGLGAFRAG
jgi:hypothetical protein